MARSHNESNEKESSRKLLTFSVDSHLLVELGEHLVSRKSIALGELVKNAYDADATKVEISLNKVRRKGGTIVATSCGRSMKGSSSRT